MKPDYDKTDEIDPVFYRKLYPDLIQLGQEEAKHHFRQFGCAEGRIPNAGAVREHFLETIPTDQSTLEIGPFANPGLRGSEVAYADFYSQDELIQKAKQIGLDPNQCPEIRYVLSKTSLGKIADKFFNVFSSHCIEHQPDLVTHLRDVAKILHPGGSYYLIIPDKRFCFDHFIPESTIADVMAAHMAGRTKHDLRSVVAHASMTTHNDCNRHWEGDHGVPCHEERPELIPLAIKQHMAAAGAYQDCHAWQFTPLSFGKIAKLLHDLHLTELRPIAVYSTLRPRMEFCAVLTKTT